MPNHSDTVTQPVNKLVEKVYVLSVKTFDVRIAHIQKEMRKYNIDFEFVFDYDIPDLDSQVLADMFGASALTMAQKSLVLKHIQAWKDAEVHGLQRVLIFEDDVILHNDFVHQFEVICSAVNKLPPDFLVFLGGADAKVPDSYLMSKETLVALPIATAEGYMTDISAIKRRLAWLKVNKIVYPADHLICSIDKLHHAPNYWSRQPIVEQGSVTGIFDSALDSHRQKHSRRFNIYRYRWNKFQRHVLRAWIAHVKYFFAFIGKKP